MRRSLPKAVQLTAPCRKCGTAQVAWPVSSRGGLSRESSASTAARKGNRGSTPLSRSVASGQIWRPKIPKRRASWIEFTVTCAVSEFHRSSRGSTQQLARLRPPKPRPWSTAPFSPRRLTAARPAVQQGRQLSIRGANQMSNFCII